MATAPSYFKDFLKKIRLSDSQRSDLITGHTTLRERLESDEDLSPIIVNTFLQGSYRRSTAVKPKDGSRADVDVIVVTNINADTHTPQEVLDMFIPFLDRYYASKYRVQGRSIGIELSYVDLDIVPTSAPSEQAANALRNSVYRSDSTVEDMYQYAHENKSLFAQDGLSYLLESKDEPVWKSEPLLIPDREAGVWERTHPLEQISWTYDKNKKCNGHYVNVVKSLKWWKKVNMTGQKHPKSYPLEHFIGDCCPDGIESVAEGVVTVLEKITSEYPTKPCLPDRGVPEHDVFGRLSDKDYELFHKAVSDAAKIAREAYDSTDLNESVAKWKELFGDEFPDPSGKKNPPTGGFASRTNKAESIPIGRFA